MSTRWLVETRGDPLGAVKKIMVDAWQSLDIDFMLVSTNGSARPEILTHPAELEEVNPFKPLMTKNIAKYIPELIQDMPESRVGALLRPCEMRALKGKLERLSFPEERLATICVDCLRTYPQDDYQWRSERRSFSAASVSGSLQFARQGGIAAYRFRSACQACRSPIGQDGDINIGVIGLPVRHKILVQARQGFPIEHSTIERQPAQEEADLLDQRDRIVARLLQRCSRTRKRLIDNLESILPGDLDALLDQFEGCGECRDCLDACPLCDVEFPAKNTQGRYLKADVTEWMTSCAGCGMCEQACPNHLPLVSFFSFIQGQLIQSVNQTATIH